MTQYIDLRSDADSQPTQEMREAIFAAKLGDAILDEDPTVNELEQRATELFGVGAALLTVSGTMSNQIAVMTLTDRGDEIIVGRDSHIYNLEVAGLAALSQVQARPINVENGCYDTDELARAIKTADIQTAKTGLICLENTYNLNFGQVVPLENLAAIRQIANRHGIPVFLDGARLFNAAAYLNVGLEEICQYADATQVCLTKGLGCPIGSLLLGSASFIQQAKRYRQRLGGGMRQAGMIAAAGIVGLTKLLDQIPQDNLNAALLLEGLKTIPGIEPAAEHFQTNIISIDIHKHDYDADWLIRALKQHQILVKKIGHERVRLVTYHQISRAEINRVVQCIKNIMESARRR